MSRNQVILVLFCGAIWKSLSTAIPQASSVRPRNPYASTGSPAADKAPRYGPQATGSSLHRSGRALALPTPSQFPDAYAEPSDGSWVAALLIGIILLSMILAIIIIVVWKGCKRPVLVDSIWAGRSPFADGDTPDVFMDSDQAPKRSSVLFMLPWKSRQDTSLEQGPAAPEKSPSCSASNEQGSMPPDGTATTPPAPTTGEVGCARPTDPPEPLDLPPPPEWLSEPAKEHSTSQGSDLGEHQELRSEAEEQLPPPPPPESLIHEVHEPLPQTGHPL
ncbi:EVI2B protein, partial [Trogon melanurus]|nr:EVI2B protein [Trogon melanurus]